MSLNLVALSTQIRTHCQALVTEADERHQRHTLVRARLIQEHTHTEAWGVVAASSSSTCRWLLAYPVESLHLVHDVSFSPLEYSVLATDGSHVDADRHSAALYALINVGNVFIRYGRQPSARLSSKPTLITPHTSATQEADTLEDLASTVRIRRDFAEIQALADLAEQTNDDCEPCLALVDGSLLRWSLQDATIDDVPAIELYLAALERLRICNVLLAAYISRPYAPEIVGLTRLMHCPDVALAEGRGPICKQCSDRAARRIPSCFACNGLTDAALLADRLREGQRSSLFCSLSSINLQAYEHHLVHFFYMRVGAEVARIEVPNWVASNPQYLAAVHALIYDQCGRGEKYPVALARAHEQAVIRGRDRTTFEAMISGELQRAGLTARVSNKLASKGRQAL